MLTPQQITLKDLLSLYLKYNHIQNAVVIDEVPEHLGDENYKNIASLIKQLNVNDPDSFMFTSCGTSIIITGPEAELVTLLKNTPQSEIYLTFWRDGTIIYENK